MLSSNLYKEQSLGIYSSKPLHDEVEDFETTHKFFGVQLHTLLAHDLYFLVGAIWLTMIVEEGQFERDPVNFSVFDIMFKTVSAYGVHVTSCDCSILDCLDHLLIWAIVYLE
ncbi:Potassium transport protein 1 [Neolecta irregularis DAH-3]|uniref:Potassium transport protein 1 n=1 Tax=Neolecta irregularis (strain DAH-3) TaxID=1198029 RepID=A0A1U7LWX7_NEOID|nr:Potassium transport protein 1 [Neolecta irregularis DAH-3]|eukprot:OLL27052.1 Potassium transport protein 1 [Neolecta irregularis DAH-3]